MASAEMTHPLAAVQTVADLLDRLGGITPERVRLHPLPGTATEKDVLAARRAPERRLCELIDGVLVEKPMGTKESQIALLLGYFLLDYLRTHDLGIALGADGFIRLSPGLVRLPDLAFIGYERLPGDELPDEAIATIVPDLAVEVLSPSNTRKEIDQKLHEYFQAGVRLIWVIHPKTATAEAFTAPDERTRIGKAGTLDGGDVLPGFRLALSRLFTRKGPRRGRS